MTHFLVIHHPLEEPGETVNASRLLAKLEDFRLLPIFVIVSMAIGIAIGKALSISDFELTPPIDALKSIAGGTFELSVASALSLGVPIGLFLMMYPAMTNVRLGEVGSAFRSPRQLGVVLLFNYLVAPFLMLLLANLFVSDPELHTGLVLYGLAPCIAMVIVFTYLAKGNVPMALVFVALNSPPHRERRLRRPRGRRERAPVPRAAARGGRADAHGRRAARRRRGHGAAQAGPQRPLDPGPPLHAHRDVLPQG
jgi:hypothetical protein